MKIRNECSSLLVLLPGSCSGVSFHICLLRCRALPHPEILHLMKLYFHNFYLSWASILAWVLPAIKPTHLFQALHMFPVSSGFIFVSVQWCFGSVFSDIHLELTPPFPFSLFFQVTETNIFEILSFGFPEAYHEIWK